MLTAYTQNNPGQLISDNAGYQVRCSTFKVKAVEDTYCVELYSVDTSTGANVRLTTLTLSAAELQAFQAALNVPHASV